MPARRATRELAPQQMQRPVRETVQWHAPGDIIGDRPVDGIMPVLSDGWLTRGALRIARVSPVDISLTIYAYLDGGATGHAIAGASLAAGQRGARFSYDVDIPAGTDIGVALTAPTPSGTPGSGLVLVLGFT